MRKTVMLIAPVLPCFMLCAFSPPAPAQNGPSLEDYAGRWAFKYERRNFIVLTLRFADGHLTGIMAMPKHFQMSQGGDITHISSEVGEETVSQASISGGHLEFITHRDNDVNRFSMSFVDSQHASLELIGIPLAPWKLERVGTSEKVAVATDWPEEGPKNVTPEIAALQSEIRQMVAEDQAARIAQTQISDSKVAQVDAKNYPALLRIYQKFGLPHISVVGEDAASEFWLLVQHQDTHLDFQKRVLRDMKRAADEGEASKVNYAYLYDRVMVNEGKPQHWGTQITCKNGKTVLDPVDNPAGLAQRREELQLMPLDKYLEMLAPHCKDSGQAKPPRSNLSDEKSDVSFGNG